MTETTNNETNPRADEPLRSVHTSNLPERFDQLGISLVVSTYQAGKVIVLRSDGNVLNTHFRDFSKPMGITADASRLTIGGTNTIWYYRNMPAVARDIEPVGKHDACFLPRRIHVTGDIDIHELAWDAADELWIINTRFSCLCTLDADTSFVPHWRPSFVSALSPEDRCHLNGLCMRDGRPGWVTALGQSDKAGGWRPTRASGGVLIDVDTNEIVLQGLSMPHSPRLYQGRLYVLESGQGSLVRVNLSAGTWETIVQLPGFTRGIDFVGPLAFIGLSQVRESAVFSGIPLVERLPVTERCCGVWVVDIERGETVGFVRFEAGVREIFAVQALREARYPELLEFGDARLSGSYMLPDEALADVRMPSAEEQSHQPGPLLQQAARLHGSGDLDGSIAAFRAAYASDPDFPNARFNLAVALSDTEHFEEATGLLRRVIDDEPERADAYNALGFVKSRLGQPADAVACFEKAIQLDTEFAKAHFNLGMQLLELGDLKRGFAEYEWRWRTADFTPFAAPHPRWHGAPIADQTLLIHTEQGAGDTIQFARFLPLAAARCKRLVVVAPPALHPLLATLPGVSALRGEGEIGVAQFDTFAPLMSLPHILGTARDTIPAAVPYIDIAILRRRFGERPIPQGATPRLRIGIAWAGSPTHRNDRNRSIPAQAFSPLLDCPGVEVYSLQKGPQATELQDPALKSIRDLGPSLAHFGHTALAISQLDLVVSVDTAVAHLAAALGKPTWTLLGPYPDWRWGLAGDTSPWYPTMKFYRRTGRESWEAVVMRAAGALASL